jgi:uncharacterized membrane protein SpoIIM required for sporulation
MSGLESTSNGREDDAVDVASPAEFMHWRGLLSVSLGLVLAPTVALVNQQLVYTVNMWACGHGLHGVIHIIPALCLVVVAGTGIGAYLNWVAVGRGLEDERDSVATRTRFAALLGMAISLFSAIVIVAQWAAIFVFDPCMRA